MARTLLIHLCLLMISKEIILFRVINSYSESRACLRGPEKIERGKWQHIFRLNRIDEDYNKVNDNK